MLRNSKELLEKYTEILLSNGIQDKVRDVIVSDGGTLGDGMLSVTQCITVTFEDQGKSPLNLFVKLHTQSPSHEVILEDLKAFHKEAIFFMQYVPAAKEFCSSKGLGDFIDFYPKCFYGDVDMIVLENLTTKEYALAPYDKHFDYNTAVLALKTLAKHHAVSHAMIQCNGGLAKFFQRFTNLDHDGTMTQSMIDMLTGFCENAIKTATTFMERTKVNGAEEILEKLNEFTGVGVIRDLMLNSLQYDKDVENLLFLIHGDYKKNNMMFLKDKETNAILHHIVIDLQLTRYNTPSLDLAYFLFSSVCPKVREGRLQDLLNEYRHTLNDVSKVLGFPVHISFEDLFMQYRRKFKYGFFIALTLVGPGIELIKTAGIDVSKIDMKNLANIYNECLLKWMDQNPDKATSVAEEIKDLVLEYTKLDL